MNTTQHTYTLHTEEATRAFGERIGRALRGGEVLELIGDIGAGKTALTKGISKGLGVTDDVQSPTFTISRIYRARDGLSLAHYDFYRLSDPGILKMELHEVVHDPHTVTVIEWGRVVQGILPDSKISIILESVSDTSRQVTIIGEIPEMEKSE